MESRRLGTEGSTFDEEGWGVNGMVIFFFEFRPAALTVPGQPGPPGKGRALGEEKTGCLPVILKGGCTIPFLLQPPRARLIVDGGRVPDAAGTVPLFVHMCKFVYFD